MFTGFGIQNCAAMTSRSAIIMVSPSDGAEFYNMRIRDNEARVFKLSKKSVTKIANSHITDNQGKSGAIFAATRATVEATNTSFQGKTHNSLHLPILVFVYFAFVSLHFVSLYFVYVTLCLCR